MTSSLLDFRASVLAFDFAQNCSGFWSKSEQKNGVSGVSSVSSVSGVSSVSSVSGVSSVSCDSGDCCTRGGGLTLLLTPCSSYSS
ncbi:MAG: hypothetical protein MJZ63_07055 [Muribaculaceae bacterium]|nr:hypothetical protein [Muribaculaceae bacterium]